MVVLLHGFLGTRSDWDPLFSFLPNDLCTHAVDLPGHGTSPIEEDIIAAVKKSIDPFKPTTLVGYSAGGRIALLLKDRYPDSYDKVIVLSGHPGIACELERAKRWEQDRYWLNLLRAESMSDFLTKWYAQPLFDSLRKHPGKLQELIAFRSQQDPSGPAAFLERMSSGLLPPPRLFPKTLFLFGQEDLKYRELYLKLPPFIKVRGIENSGHILPFENPQGCARAILDFLEI